MFIFAEVNGDRVHWTVDHEVQFIHSLFCNVRVFDIDINMKVDIYNVNRYKRNASGNLLNAKTDLLYLQKI